MTLRKLLSFVSLRWREPSLCEACGDQFICGATIRGCWCTEIKLGETTRAQLRERYKQCLCRACLERFAKSDGARDDDN
jgi:hypothetical protein